ncbi:MAG: hypothetical protein AAFR66_17900 [Bacteroidota bacterium]
MFWYISLSTTVLLAAGGYIFAKLNRTVDTVAQAVVDIKENKAVFDLVALQITNIQKDLTDLDSRTEGIERTRFSKEMADVQINDIRRRLRKVEQKSGL